MDGKMFVAITQWWTTPIKALEVEFNEDERSHAGCAETSINLTVHPWLVKMDKAVNEIRGEGVAPEGFTYAADTLDRTSSGVSGTSTTASSDKGKKVFDENVDLMTKFIEQLRNTKIEDLLPKPHKS
jgi:creatinine amidohydrolase/Fe(II)-dependent formamide hydrolase-like protein